MAFTFLGLISPAKWGVIKPPSGQSEDSMRAQGQPCHLEVMGGFLEEEPVVLRCPFWMNRSLRRKRMWASAWTLQVAKLHG